MLIWLNLVDMKDFFKNRRTFLTANIFIEQKSSFDNHFYLKLDERTWNGLIFVCKLWKLEGWIWSAVYDLWITVIITVEFTTDKAGQIRSSSRLIDVFFLWENYLELKSKFYEQVKA